MKKILLLIVVSLFFVKIFAAYLENVPVILKQPDGTILNCFATGDEFHNWLHDSNNYTIIQNSKTGYYVYAIKINDELVASDFVVGKVNPVLLNIPKGLNISFEKIELKRKAFNSELKSKSKLHNVKSLKSLQTINNVVIFIRFSDETEFTEQINVYDSMFNSQVTTANSMSHYFKEMSYDQLAINSTLYPQTTNTVLSYQDIYARSYYQPYDATLNPDGYIDDSDRGFREHLLLKNAVDYVSSEIPTSINLDYNSDGYVDNVCFIIKGNVGGWAELLWPHRWALYNETAYINGLQVYDYNFQLQEFFFLPTRGVGVLCHEMFHTLGAPDLYHYSLDYRNFRAVGYWDLMDRSSNPSQSMLIYMKYLYAGWITEIPEITTPGTYTLNPSTSQTNNSYQIVSPTNPNEIFMFEYRKKEGAFESSLHGQGLLIYRINMSAQYMGNSDYPNNPDEVYVYRPDGIDTTTGKIDSAAFSLNSGRIAFSNSTNPACLLSDNTDGGITITNITAIGNTISFCYNCPNNIEIDKLNSEIKCFPNPVTDHLIVDIPMDIKNVKVRIINSVGDCVFEDNIINNGINKINVSSLTKGIYQVLVLSDNMQYNSKLIKY
ncbi:MAG: M6 family metalloprotease domain-containing protein [Bacteroidia bacterium]|nr:M6 family metalloprotease domain-containing protein [Bacteroidia bacterium]